MGSGKSTIAQALASQLGYHKLDTDTALVQLTGQTVEELFKKQGEAYFRSKESELLRFLTELDKIVIATGGGLPVFHNNMSRLLASGLTIYLDCEAETLADRIHKDRTTRPLHPTHISLAETLRQIRLRLEKRKAIYEEAHLVLNGAKKPEEIVREILVKIQGAD